MKPIRLQIDGRLILAEGPLQGDPLPHLGYPVDLAATCTLRSFFAMLGRYPSLAALNPFAGQFRQYCGQCPTEGCISDGIEYLALWRTIEIIGHPPPPRMLLTVSLDGYRGTRRQDIRPYGLESLLDTPLRLGRLNHVVFGDTLNSLQFDTVFNLFDLIDGICWQLSFHNLPAECRLPT